MFPYKLASDDTKDLQAAMLKAQKDIKDPEPNAKSHFSKKGDNDYADLHATLDAVRPACVKHGIRHAVKSLKIDGEWVWVLYLCHPESGQFDATNSIPMVDGANPMARMSDKTYASRQLYSTEFGIAVDNDDNGLQADNAHHANKGSSNKTKQAQQFLTEKWNAAKTDEQKARFAMGSEKTIASGAVTQEWVDQLMAGNSA